MRFKYATVKEIETAKIAMDKLDLKIFENTIHELKYIYRFLNRFTIVGGCWEWNKAIGVFGYGAISVGGNKTILTHKFSYQAFIGNVPKGKYVLHVCDNPKCVNPNHLYLGTPQDNVNDKFKRERQNRKISKSDVLEIRKSTLKTGELAKIYGVKSNCIYKIKTFKSWNF